MKKHHTWRVFLLLFLAGLFVAATVGAPAARGCVGNKLKAQQEAAHRK